MQVHGIRVSRTLEAIDAAPFPVAATPSVTIMHGVAANGGGFLAAGRHTYGLCWLTPLGFMKHVTADGAVEPAGSGRPVIETGREITPLGVFSAAGVDVALWGEWQDGPKLLAARASRDGTRLDAEPILVQEEGSVVAASDGARVFLLDRSAKKEWLLDAATGAVVSGSVRGDVYAFFDVAWSGHDYVAAGADFFLDWYKHGDLLLARFAADGALSSVTKVASVSDPTQIRIVVADRQAAIFWLKNEGVYAVAVDDAGRVTAGPRLLAGGTYPDDIWWLDAVSDGKSILMISATRRRITLTLLSAQLDRLDSTMLDESSSGFAGGRIDGRWLVSWMGAGGRKMLAFRSLHPLDGSVVTIGAYSPAPFGILRRPDGTAAAMLLGTRERSGTFGPVSGPVVVTRKIELIPARRRAANP